MTVYKVPEHSPNQLTFRILSIAAISLIVGLLIFSRYEPQGISDSTGHAIGWAAMVILCVFVFVATALGVKEGTWKLKRATQVELADGKIICAREGLHAVEIPLTRIGLLREYRGGLIIGSNESTGRILVPREVNDFEGLKNELGAYCTLTPLKGSILLRTSLPLAFMIVVYLIFFTSHTRTVVMTAGVAALTLQGIGIYSLRLILRGQKISRILMPALLLFWLLLAWIVYARIAVTTY